jgi:hypothetical protein
MKNTYIIDTLVPELNWQLNDNELEERIKGILYENNLLYSNKCNLIDNGENFSWDIVCFHYAFDDDSLTEDNAKKLLKVNQL